MIITIMSVLTAGGALLTAWWHRPQKHPIHEGYTNDQFTLMVAIAVAAFLFGLLTNKKTN